MEKALFLTIIVSIFFIIGMFIPMYIDIPSKMLWIIREIEVMKPIWNKWLLCSSWLSPFSFFGAFFLFLSKQELNEMIECILLSLTLGMIIYIGRMISGSKSKKAKYNIIIKVKPVVIKINFSLFLKIMGNIHNRSFWF